MLMSFTSECMMVLIIANANSIEADVGEVSVPQFHSHFPLLPFWEIETNRIKYPLTMPLFLLR
jgi:hypothetical protein